MEWNELDAIIFLVEFKHEADLQNVKNGMPNWMFDNHSLCLKEFDSETSGFRYTTYHMDIA